MRDVPDTLAMDVDELADRDSGEEREERRRRGAAPAEGLEAERERARVRCAPTPTTHLPVLALAGLPRNGRCNIGDGGGAHRAERFAVDYKDLDLVRPRGDLPRPTSLNCCTAAQPSAQCISC